MGQSHQVRGQKVMRIFSEFVLCQEANHSIQPVWRQKQQEYATDNFQYPINTFEGDADVKDPIQEWQLFEASLQILKHRAQSPYW